MRPSRPTAAALAAAAVILLIQLHAATAAYVALSLEHAFGSGDFSTAGTLKGDLDGQVFGGLELQRVAWSAEDTAQFAQLARDDGLYRLRLQPSGGSHVLASLRARCLAAAGFQEQLTLHVGSDGSVTGLEYNALSPQGCPPGLQLTEGQLQGLAPGTAPQTVNVVQPASAPRILLETYLTAQQGAAGAGAGAAAGVAGVQSSKAGQQRQQQQQGGAAASGKEGKAAPPPDERSWIQKNWIFLIPIGLLIFNTLGGLQPAVPGQSSGSGAAAQ